MKCSKHCVETPGGSSTNMVDLLSSVNTLIDNLSDGRQGSQSAKKTPTATANSAASAAAAAAAAEIDKQLQRLDRLFAKSNERRRRRQRHRQQQLDQQQQQQQQRQDKQQKTTEFCRGGGSGACSRSPCSNCTTSNCNAMNNVSISDSSEESGQLVRCCAINASTKCVPAAKQMKIDSQQKKQPSKLESKKPNAFQKQQQIVQLQLQQPAAAAPGTSSSNHQPGGAGMSETLSLVSQNASNRRQYVLRRGRKPPPDSTKRFEQRQQQKRPGGGNWRGSSPEGTNAGAGGVDFNFLKDGLAAGRVSAAEQDEGRMNCGNAVAQMERMVKSLQLLTDRLKRQYEQRHRRQRVDQQRRGFGGCSWENSMTAARLKAEIRQAQMRAACLRNCLRAALGGSACGGGSGDGPNSAPVGCRHRGAATEQTRDPITDIKCKYERCLLYSRYDVNWPFLHIIAPAPPILVDPICCEED